MKTSAGITRLLATCGALTVALAPHLTRLPVWISAGFFVAVALRLLAEQRGWGLPPRLVRYVIALAGTLGVLATFRTLNGLEAGTAMLATMAAVKLSETRAPRDHAVLLFVGYLLALATLLFGQSLLRLGYALAAAWLLTAALARVHRPVEANTEVRPFRVAARILALGAPLAVLMFLFVPRIEGRFWALPTSNGGTSAATGISDQMSPGDIAHLGLSDDPAFRVWFTGAQPPSEQRYWRMLALEDFDGRTWRRTQQLTEGLDPDVVPAGPRYRYRVVLEATQREWVPGLDTVVDWPRGELRRGHAAELERFEAGAGDRTVTSSRYSYTLGSATGATMMAAGMPIPFARLNLALPSQAAPRTRALAAELRAAASSDRDYIERVLDKFRREPFSYTLEPRTLGREPVDEFLFSTREGFCEHYASAFAVLMRAAGIPARVVIGYQGGEANAYGGYLLVRQSSAHAWDEVWLRDAGWVRVDPTAVVAPERIRRSSAGQDVDADGRARNGSFAWLGRARALWDAARTRLADAIINFDPRAQMHLLDLLGVGLSGWEGLAIALIVGFGAGALLLGGWLAWEARPRRRAPVDRAWEDLCDRLARLGLPREPAEGAIDYGRRVAAARPALAAGIGAVVDAYVATRYLPGATADDARRFIELAARLTKDLRRQRP